MFFLISTLFRNELRIHYPTRWSWLLMLASVFVSLSIYWFTSKALSPNLSDQLDWQGMNYFSYVVLGEIIITLPALVFSQFVKSANALVTQNSLDQILMVPSGIRKFLSLQFLAGLGRDLVSLTATVLVASLLFGLQCDGRTLLIGLGVVSLSLPAFWGLGSIAAVLCLRFGRGQGVLQQFNMLASVFAGTYFPLTVFPPMVSDLLLVLSPYTATLQSVRLLNAGEIEAATPALLSLLIWSFLFLPAGLWALKWADHSCRKGRFQSFVLR